MTTDRREAVVCLIDIGLAVGRACAVMRLGRASFYRKPKDWRQADADVIDALNAVLKRAPAAGFWKCYRRLRRAGHTFNHKRVYRVYCQMGLNQKRRTKRVLPKRQPKPLEVIAAPNRQWAMDFMHDTLYCGRRFRTLNVVDEGTRECLGIEVDTSLPAGRVVRMLEQLKHERGLPEQIRLDNGPEFISAELIDWCEQHRVELAYIEPGKPQQNGFAERFNGSFRREFLDLYLFETLDQVRDMAWVWMCDYNDERTHESLGDLPPRVYRQKLENSSLALSR